MDTSVYPVLHVTPWDPGLAAKRDSSERLHKEGQNDADDHGASKSSRIGSLSSSALWIKFKVSSAFRLLPAGTCMFSQALHGQAILNLARP